MNSNISEAAKTPAAGKPKLGRAVVRLLPGLLEFFLVCAGACTVAALHVFALKGANLSLLFDGFGFLATTSGCLSVFNADLFGQIFNYCASGFSDSLRTRLAAQLHPADLIVRSGPLLPMLLGTAYTIAGKAPVPQYWVVGTWSMWLTQSLTVGLVWLSCRLAFNQMVARIAALICIFYPAFVINSNRVSTETQACFAVTLTMTLFLYYAKTNFQSPKTLFSGLLAGLVLGFLSLARPPFLPLPLVMVAAISFIAWRLKLPNPFSKKWFCGAICGAVIFLAPWALCNKIITNKASITIDRFAIYNLYTGLNTATLGYDIMPSEQIAHPERFKKTLGEALQEVAANATNDPANFLAMAVLKPLRLFDSPWNDYQNSCLGLPWLVQRYAHQVMLLFAFFGAFALWTKALASKTLSEYSAALLLSLIVVYNLVHVLFISMARYCYPIMPCLIVLSAYGIAATFENRKRYLVLAATLAAPLISFLVENLSVPPFMVLPELALQLGIIPVSLLAAVLVGLAFGGAAAAGLTFCSESKQLKVYLALSAAIALVASFATFYGTRQLTYPLQTQSVRVTIPDSESKSCLWFVVIDPLLEGFSLDALRTCKLTVNGEAIQGDLVPLMGRDTSQRESFVYLKAFAHSGQKDVTAFRHWYCLPVQSSMLRFGQENVVEFKNDEGSSSKCFVMNDFVASGKAVAPLSLLKFSWSKGFTSNPPLDMRMLENESRSGELSSLGKEPSSDPNVRIQPRICLLSVDADSCSSLNSGAPASAHKLQLGDQRIDKKKSKIVSLPVSSAQLTPVIDAIKAGDGNTIQLRLSGRCKSDTTHGMVSIALLTSTNAEGKMQESMAPMAPEILSCTSDGVDFSFIDLVPVNGAKQNFECSTRILIAGRPWWDVLQYGTFKVDEPVSVSNLKLETSVCTLPDLSKQSFRVYKSLPISK